MEFADDDFIFTISNLNEIDDVKPSLCPHRLGTMPRILESGLNIFSPWTNHGLSQIFTLIGIMSKFSPGLMLVHF